MKETLDNPLVFLLSPPHINYLSKNCIYFSNKNLSISKSSVHQTNTWFHNNNKLTSLISFFFLVENDIVTNSNVLVFFTQCYVFDRLYFTAVSP